MMQRAYCNHFHQWYTLQAGKASGRMRSGASWRHKPSLGMQLTANPDDPFALLSLPSGGGDLLSWGSLNPQVGTLAAR